MNMPKQIRREQAEFRRQLRAERTPQQQIEALDARLGKDKDACKERARLFLLIEQGSKS